MCILPLTTFLFLLSCRARAAQHSINQPLATRIAAGECSSEGVESGGTFFPSEKRATFEGEHPHFEIVYAPTFKVVVNKLSKAQIVLTQCGQPMPSEEQVDKVAPLDSYTRSYLTVPVQNFSARTLDHHGYLSTLDVADRVVSATVGAVEPCWQKAYNCIEFPLPPEVEFRATADGKAVHIPLTKDLSALQTAEYIKFFGVFFNKDAEANQLYTNIRNALEAAGSGYAVRPVVAWIEFKKSSNQVWVSRQPYKLDLVVAAGGENFNVTVLKELPGFQASENAVEEAYTIDFDSYDNTTTASARFFEALAGVDVVIDTTSASNKPHEYGFDDFLDNFFLENSTCSTTCKFMLNKMVLRTDGTFAAGDLKSSDWIETSKARPDWAAVGLARKIHDDNSKAFRYFHNIALQEKQQNTTADMCDEEVPVCVKGKARVIPLLGDGQVVAPEAPSAPNNTWWYVIGGLIVVVGIIGCVVYLNKASGQGDAQTEETLATELAS